MPRRGDPSAITCDDNPSHRSVAGDVAVKSGKKLRRNKPRKAHVESVDASVAPSVQHTQRLTSAAVEETPAQTVAHTSFEQLGIQPWLVKQCRALAMEQPTLVQRLCIPSILAGKHTVGGALTGSGKTAAFALPILQLLAEEMYGVFSLVLTPSRELAYQILDQFIAFGAPCAARTAVVIGGVHHDKQLDALKARPHIVVATPGRLKFMLEKFPEVLQAFQNIRFLVLDEADRITEGDIATDTAEVVELLGPPRPFRRTLLFTATLHERLTNVSCGFLASLGVNSETDLVVHTAGVPLITEASPKNVFSIAPTLDERYLFIPVSVKLPYLVALLKSRGPKQSTIVFANSCVRCETVRLVLQLLGFPVCSLNSLLTQQHRLDNLAMFKMGLSRVLVATDIAARGLDIPEVDLVVHYDMPKLPATYVHRVGRTARAGRNGLSVGLVTEHDVSLVHTIERRTKTSMKLYFNKRVNDEVVVSLLDEVSTAKIQAKLQITEQFGDRAATLKEHAAEKKTALNRDIRHGGHRADPSISATMGATSNLDASSEAQLKRRRLET